MGPEEVGMRRRAIEGRGGELAVDFPPASTKGNEGWQLVWSPSKGKHGGRGPAERFGGQRSCGGNGPNGEACPAMEERRSPQREGNGIKG